MNEYLARARAYWADRTPRERGFLGVGIGVLAFGLAYGLIVAPLAQANKKLAASLPTQRAELRLVRAQVAEIERLRGKGGASAPSGGALVHAVETAAAAHGAREALANLTPLAKDRVQITTRPLPVTAWLAWFADLEQQGITIESCRASGDGKSGQVSIEATLTGGAE